MAITILKEPSGIYPVYNNSFIEFSSDLADNNKAEISVLPLSLFPKVFVIYPDSEGKYLFNLKEAAKVQLNAGGFKDSNFFTDSFSKSISGLYLSQDITIKVLSDSAEEQVSKTYEFFKAVQQIGEKTISSPFKLLSYTLDGVNHSATYFEGFPFHLDIQRVLYVSGKNISVKSINSGNTSPNMPVTADGAFRLNIDRGNNDNWTDSNFLSLFEGLNKLEVYEDTTFKINIALTKKKNCKGLYLKWFNSFGGYSYFLFSHLVTETTTGANIANILNSDFDNISDMSGNVQSIGKEGSRSLAIKTKYTAEEYNILKDLLISPFVQFYTSQEAYVEGVFIDVSVSGSFPARNKNAINEASFIIQLPELTTAKL